MVIDLNDLSGILCTIIGDVGDLDGDIMSAYVACRVAVDRIGGSRIMLLYISDAGRLVLCLMDTRL